MQEGKAGFEIARDGGGCSSHGPVDVGLLREIRWLRILSRVGSDTVCPGAHLRLCTERGSGGGEREHCSNYDCTQAAQDDNTWDLAYPLMLLEEPPSQLWSYRPAVTQGRLRAFAPLCAQKCAIVALAYAKEADYIQNRKAEISKPKQQATEVSPGVPKAKPKRRPKWQGGEPASSSSKPSAEA